MIIIRMFGCRIRKLCFLCKKIEKPKSNNWNLKKFGFDNANAVVRQNGCYVKKKNKMLIS